MEKSKTQILIDNKQNIFKLYWLKLQILILAESSLKVFVLIINLLKCKLKDIKGKIDTLINEERRK